MFDSLRKIYQFITGIPDKYSVDVLYTQGTEKRVSNEIVFARTDYGAKNYARKQFLSRQTTPVIITSIHIYDKHEYCDS